MPGARLEIKFSNLTHPKQFLHSCFENHPLNHAVHLVLPSGAPLSVDATSILQKWSSMYTIVEAQVHLVLQKSFLDQQLSTSRSFVAVTAQGHIDQHDTAAITPDRHLRMSVCKDTFQQLGIVGKSSILEAGDRYTIDVHFGSKQAQANGRHHVEVLERLAKNTRPAVMLCLATNTSSHESEDVSWPAGVRVRDRMAVSYSQHSLQQVSVPQLEQLRLRDDHGVISDAMPGVVRAAAEWLGAACCGFALQQMSHAGLALAQGYVQVHKWQGLLASHQVSASNRVSANLLSASLVIQER